MEMQKRDRHELSFNEKRAAQLWACGIDVDGEQVSRQSDIAKRCGMTKQDFYLLRKTQAFCDEVDRLLGEQRIEAGRSLLRAVPIATERLTRIIESGEDKEAVNAAVNVLGMVGISPKRIVEVNTNDSTGVIRGGFGRSDIVLPEVNVIDVTNYDEADE